MKTKNKFLLLALLFSANAFAETVNAKDGFLTTYVTNPVTSAYTYVAETVKANPKTTAAVIVATAVVVAAVVAFANKRSSEDQSELYS